MEGTDFIGYRVGGDEFSVVLKDCDIDMVKNFADRIARMADSINRGGIKTSMSIGYAKFDAEKDRNFSMTMERADAMMYENKRLYYKTKNLKKTRRINKITSDKLYLFRGYFLCDFTLLFLKIII